ncbi:Uncharacterised protein (plasmid) [Legionella adelaidensis]|uniref:Transmembrane protein n=1 Tax=Legionella adelaidensis TaxID=45056 RepID=A0A0W0R603_9GAMM|nr:hypothetical protein [Legionella adelaidensis]KTC66444.1 hypothetical protein Lade_1102 [Legionella adelaidensis]VEH86268.1 Uncharacterised protein [Legionella adelaidensis]
MNTKLPRVLEQLLPFIGIGVAIAVGIGLFIMIAYVLVWGVLIGGLIWGVAMIKKYFFPTKNTTEGECRIIEHENK